jgi:hypothetical protein
MRTNSRDTNERQRWQSFIITGLWDLANQALRQTQGKISTQRAAFRELIECSGGVDFLICRPLAEIEELGRRGICPVHLPTTLREMTGVELRRRQKLRDLAGLEAEMRTLRRRAAGPENK